VCEGNPEGEILLSLFTSECNEKFKEVLEEFKKLLYKSKKPQTNLNI
jgi:hypothetical protein